MRILLVDDDEGFRATLWRLLTGGERTAEVEEAADGEEALRKVAHRRPDVPVLILTVHDDPLYERSARAAGADGFLLKKTAGTTPWPALTSLVPTGRLAGPGRALFAEGAPVTAPPGIRGSRAREDSPGRLGHRPDWQVCWRPL